MKTPNTRKTALTAGQTAEQAEVTALTLLTVPAYRFRTRHPRLFGLLAFILGAGFTGLVTMSTYGNWAFEGIDLKTAVYQVFFGSLAGGIVLTVLAFAYTRTIRPTLGPMAENGIISRRA